MPFRARVRRRLAVVVSVAATALAATAAAQQPLRITSITPSGADVTPGRQIVIQFDRAVVPIGRMTRSGAEIPVEITPALDCQWRWLDPSALACELGERSQMLPATRYALTVRPDITAQDGATLAAPVSHEFETERPRVSYVGFATWRGPGTPVLRAVFTQPVDRDSVREALFLQPSGGAGRVAVEVSPDEEFGYLGSGDVRNVWLVSAATELPADTEVELRVQPGLRGASGTLAGDEQRVAVRFATFPELRFLGVVCSSNDGGELLVTSGSSGRCNPLAGVGLAFSAPVPSSEVKAHVTLDPDLAGGREDYDPWANRRDYSQLQQPHERGRRYVTYLPERLRAAQRYTVRMATPGAGPKDEFGRSLQQPIELAFLTDHRPPSYTLPTSTGVLEQGIDSDIPLYVTNLESATVRYRTVTANGESTERVQTLELADVEDIQYGVPLGVRTMLGGTDGIVYGQIETQPPMPWRTDLFAQVTPYQLHLKLGHFNSLLWVVELATGEPVANATVTVLSADSAQLSGAAVTRATATTDANGIALLPGTRELDPQLAFRSYCPPDGSTRCPQLFVRVDGTAGQFALLPLNYDFAVDTYRASRYTVFSDLQPEFGHLHAWGTTAQGVYRAGDTLQYKIYVRDQNNETYVAPPAGPYRLEIVDPQGQVAHTVDGITLSRFGAVDGSWAIPANAPVGWYQFQLTAEFGSADWPLMRWPMRVLVSDFTPSPFGVATTLAGDLFGAGDTVSVTTRAALFSGGPYVDADARITAQIVPKPFVSPHPVARGFSFDSGTEHQTMIIAQSEGRIGSDGELTQSFSVPPDAGAAAVYGTLLVEGAVRDDRGRFVTGTASADFVAVDRLVGLRSDDWVLRAGERGQVEYLVVDGRGTPAAGTPVQIAVERLETRASRVRGAGNAYLTEFVDEWLPVGECAGVSTDTPQVCSFVPDAPGSFRLTATIADSQDRPHRSVLHTWVVGAGQVVWRDNNDDALEIVPEQTEYAIGDTARYLVKNPYPGARALVTLERYGTLRQWVQTLEGSTPVIEFEIEKDLMPGFYLSVLAFSPRVAAPPPEAGELDLGKPAFKLGYVAVPVKDLAKQIAVEVRTDREIYKPGERVRARIRAVPRERTAREPIEVAVAVLDEAVLDLIQGGTSYFDPYAGFNTLDGLDVQNYSLLTRLVGRQKIEKKGANPGGDGGAALSLRSVFKFVGYWNPSLELDSRGNGEFEFELPDNLTGWRVLVLAATPTDRMGLGQHSFKVNLPTEVRPALPNQVTEGDRFTAAFTVLNRTDDARDIRVTINATGDAVGASQHSETVRLEPYQRTLVTMPLQAARVSADRNRAAGSIAFAVRAGDSRDTDGLSHTLPVRKRGTLVTAASYGALDAASASETLRFPERIRTDVGDVGAILAPSVIGNIGGAFRYVRDYPYACWEQQLTRGVMAAHYLRLRPSLPEDLEWPESATLPSETLALAASFQAPNGGMTYYVPRDEYVSPYLSAYTALAFVWLREAGATVPEAVEAKLHGYLETFLRRDAAPDFYSRGMASTVRAVALAALAKRGKLTLADLARYREHVAAMSLFGKAHFLQAALVVEGGADIAREVETLIMQDSVRSGGRISFNEVLDEGYLRISATPLNASCAILSALSSGAASAEPLADVPFALVRTITQARGTRDHWENTQENVFCVNALAEYASRFESESPALIATVGIDGRRLGSARFDSARDEAVALTRPIAASDPGTDATLTIERSGSGRLYYTAQMSYVPEDDEAGAMNAGIDVRKEISVQRNGEWVLLTSPMTIRRGELVRVDLFVSLPTARNFVVVDDPIPGGLEPVNRDLANASQVDADAGAFQAAGGSLWLERDDWVSFGSSRWSFYHQELRHDAVRFYSEHLPAGHYHLSYTAQAIASGEFAAPPAKALEMYDPDVYGTSAAATLVVEEAR